MRATVLTPLLLLGWSLQAIGQSPAPASSEKPSLPNGQLQQVVALFRHGVRAPLKPIDDPKNNPHTTSPWPTPSQWGAKKWGDLTSHGSVLAKALGYDYAQMYKKMLPAGSKGFLLPDVAERTVHTALALASGLNGGGLPVTCPTPAPTSSPTPDPLFHPFEAHCGQPDKGPLVGTAEEISANAQVWINADYATQFRQLYDVLACTPPAKCEPLKNVENNSAQACLSPAKGCSGPIAWQGQFSYANTASETFLLEYVNQMDVGWGRVLTPPAKLLSMMALHEFYFEKTQRDYYVSQIQASNLLQEIKQTLNGENVPCRRIPAGYQFAAFVGHDTNIANVAALLKLSWTFTGKGTSGLPDNDPLPAGALIFELWKE
jgi:4-phytase/acid phosphatase